MCNLTATSRRHTVYLRPFSRLKKGAVAIYKSLKMLSRVYNVKLNDAFRLTQIAAKIDAQIGYHFKYINTDKTLINPKNHNIIFDKDNYYLNISLNFKNLNSNFLHDRYYEKTKYCDKITWDNWLNSEKSGFPKSSHNGTAHSGKSVFFDFFLFFSAMRLPSR